mgnify:CR=1 FL=1
MRRSCQHNKGDSGSVYIFLFQFLLSNSLDNRTSALRIVLDFQNQWKYFLTILYCRIHSKKEEFDKTVFLQDSSISFLLPLKIYKLLVILKKNSPLSKWSRQHPLVLLRRDWANRIRFLNHPSSTDSFQSSRYLNDVFLSEMTLWNRKRNTMKSFPGTRKGSELRSRAESVCWKRFYHCSSKIKAYPLSLNRYQLSSRLSIILNFLS